MTAPAKQLLLIGHDYLSAGPIEERFVARGYDVESVQVIPPDRSTILAWTSTSRTRGTTTPVLVLGARWSVYSDRVASWVNPSSSCCTPRTSPVCPMFGICSAARCSPTRTAVRSSRGQPRDRVPRRAGECRRWPGSGRSGTTTGSSAGAATVVGVNAAAPQAFVLRRNLAVQFHPEVDADSVRDWLEDGGAQDAPRLRARPRRAARPRPPPSTRTSGCRRPRCVDYFLDDVAAADGCRPIVTRTRSSSTPASPST